jgi:5'-nucleotidase
MSEKRPTILVTNDDGITAPGIRKLIEIMQRIGEVVVVAPNKPQSGMGHAVTVTSMLRLFEMPSENRHPEYSCSGTSVDCVKMALKVVLGKNPDLIVSGINHGSNASINILYSGTMAAALEGAMENIPSIGFSLDDYSHDASFEGFDHFIEKITKNVLRNGLPPATCLNVNIPAAEPGAIKGIKIVRQGQGFWNENYEKRTDPFRRHYFWLSGKFEKTDPDHITETDIWALANNYIAVVPVKVDMTAYEAIETVKSWEF